MCNLWIPSKKGGLGRNGPAWGTRQDVSPPRCGEMTRWRILGYTLRIFSAEQLVPRTVQGRSVGDRSGVPLRSQRQHQQASSTIENKPTLTVLAFISNPYLECQEVSSASGSSQGTQGQPPALASPCGTARPGSLRQQRFGHLGVGSRLIHHVARPKVWLRYAA